MKEGHTVSGHISAEEEENRQGQTDQSIISYFRDLKEKYTVPGDSRPGRGYYMRVAFWISMTCWWVISTIIMFCKVNGSLLEGTAGFVLMLVERIGFITLGMAALVRWKTCSLKKLNWKFWLAAVSLAVGSFLILRNPIRDIPYLYRPAEVSLLDWSMNSETDFDDAAVYSLWGKDKSEQLINFYINESTLDYVAEFPEDIVLKVKYLPYTKTVISISM
jgi:hypothetical protein